MASAKETELAAHRGQAHSDHRSRGAKVEELQALGEQAHDNQSYAAPGVNVTRWARLTQTHHCREMC